MIKFRLSYHKDDDIAWLNQLSKEGFAMTGFFAGFWHFDTCSPGEYEYQIDLSDRFFGVRSDYLELMQEMGIEYLGKFGFWIFFRRKQSDEPFTLYSDVEDSPKQQQSDLSCCFIRCEIPRTNDSGIPHLLLPVLAPAPGAAQIKH